MEIKIEYFKKNDFTDAIEASIDGGEPKIYEVHSKGGMPEEKKRKTMLLMALARDIVL